MNNYRITSVIALNALLVTALSYAGMSVAFAAPETPRCLSYLTVGDSACDTTPELEEEIVLDDVKEKPQDDAEMTFDEKVDDFLDNHGKPPREFVEFNLDPTLDNALRWAQKNREMMSRNKKIAAAWGQAKTILNEKEKEGEELPEFNELPEIPDYGVELPKGFKSFMDQPQYGTVDSKSSSGGAVSALSIGGGGVPTTSSSGINLNASNAANGRIGGAVLNQAVVDGLRIPISISYYFSDVEFCEDCADFEKGFAPMIEQFGDKVNVTCVDMTRAKIARNITERINCTWRPLIRGEMNARGINQVPALIIERHMAGRSEELVSGTTDMNKIREILSK
jgi:hypothetical protein